MQRLVESLANDDGELESTYINVFLATYRAFTTPQEVLELLLARYDALDESTGVLTGEQHRKTLVQALHVWLDAYPGDWKSPPNHPLLSRLLDFTHRRLLGSELELKARHRLHRFQREDQIGECHFPGCFLGISHEREELLLYEDHKRNCVIIHNKSMDV